MLGKIFDRFVEKAPVAVMAWGILEPVLSPESLNERYDRIAEKQYTRALLFSRVFQLMNLVVCKIQPSIHAAYQENKEKIETSITAVYDKLDGIDTVTSRALVRETAEQIGESVRGMNGACNPDSPNAAIIHRVRLITHFEMNTLSCHYRLGLILI